MSVNIPNSPKKRVVIVGGGFGGLTMARKLSGKDFQVVLVDRNNYHQFPPLIYQIASAGLDPGSISFPFRKLFHDQRDFYYRKAEVRYIFPEHKILQTSIGKIRYDYLVLACGTTTNYYGNKHIAEEAIPMKSVSEAMGLRNALLDNFERAVTCASEEEERELLNVVIVGGGASGVEIAGALSEMKHFVLPHDYPDMPRDAMHIYLIEGGSRLLPVFSEESSQHAEDYLKKMGVKIILNKLVTDYKDHAVILKDGMTIPTRTFIWVSGVKANPIGNLDPNLLGRGGRIKVDQYNHVSSLDGVFAIGDQCIMQGDPNYPNGHPQLAQPAIQQGKLLAENLVKIEKKQELQPFRYRNLGAMATIGRNHAVAEFNKMKISGFVAWFLWLIVHLRSILGVRNKLSVMFNWMWNYFFYTQSLRFIVYARKAKEVREREELLEHSHWGEDMLKEEQVAKGEDKKQE